MRKYWSKVLLKAESDVCNDIFPSPFAFEFAETIGIMTIIVEQRDHLLRGHFQCFHCNNQISSFYAICPHILHCRSPHFSRNMGEIFQTIIVVCNHQSDEIVHFFACAHSYVHGGFRFFYLLPTFNATM